MFEFGKAVRSRATRAARPRGRNHTWPIALSGPFAADRASRRATAPPISSELTPAGPWPRRRSSRSTGAKWRATAARTRSSFPAPAIPRSTPTPCGTPSAPPCAAPWRRAEFVPARSSACRPPATAMGSTPSTAAAVPSRPASSPPTAALRRQSRPGPPGASRRGPSAPSCNASGRGRRCLCWDGSTATAPARSTGLRRSSAARITCAPA